MTDVFYSIRRAIKYYTSGGVLLIATTLLAIIVANSPLGTLYQEFCAKTITLSIGGFNFFSHHGQPLTVMQFTNDALMALFFFTIGLEIKREVLVGELSSLRQAMLPVISAFGGMIVPVGVFMLFAGSPDVMRGAAIPMATDIAFSLGILAMLGKRVPIAIKIFLTALAVVDDLGGILVIAIFYSGHIAVSYLLWTLPLFAVLIAGGLLRVNSKLFYIVLGGIIWFLFLNSGVHPTISGVLVAFCIPARPRLDTRRYINRIRRTIKHFPVTWGSPILSKEQINMLKSVESASDRVISPLQDMEDSLHPLVHYLVIPLFAFVNAGIVFSGMHLSDLYQGAGLAVLAGLFLGKFLGIFSFTYLVIKLRIVSMPQGSNWPAVAGVSMLGGIGFTVSLFIANLSYAGLSGVGELLLNQAKLGIILGSVLSGVIGYFILKFTLPKQEAQH